MSSLTLLCKDIIQRFPLNTVRYAFCYGSGAFQQTGSKMSSNVLDFVLVTSNSKMFHQENLRMNGSDYSLVKALGLAGIMSLQKGSVYYNTLVKHGSRTIKYGVVDSKDFIDDLVDWTSLYLSGRLHKPVHEVLNAGDPSITTALSSNLSSALHTSLLIMPENFTETDLYLTIASLSYSGDFRMTVGEDRNKISNIVIPNIAHFRSLYLPVLEKVQYLTCHSDHSTYSQSLCSQSRRYHVDKLPVTVRNKMQMFCSIQGHSLESIAEDHVKCMEYVNTAVSEIVKASSFRQTFNAALTAGIIKSVKYASAKLMKMVRSKTR